LRQAVQGISDIITIPGIINRDFADVKTTMAGMGYAVMGTAIGSGENRAIQAAMAAMASPLLEEGAIDGAKGILINISGSSTLKLSEVNAASSLIQNAAHEDANIIFGAVLDEAMGDEVKITVIATGFREDMPERRERMLTSALREATQPRAQANSSSDAPQTPRFMSELDEEVEYKPIPVASKVIAAAPVIVHEPVHVADPEPVAAFELVPVAEPVAVAVAEPMRQADVFGQAIAEEEGENLDIPAFMRRGGL
jgi:cell division protein FtsZ